MAAATFGAGLGGAALPSLNAWLIETNGPAAGCLALGLITLLTLVPLALFVIKDGPETLGLQIDGGDAVNEPKADVPDKDPDTRDRSVPEAMRRTAFWGLALCLGFGMMAQSAFLFHQAPFLSDQMGLMAVAGIISVTTLAGIAGRVVFILIGDRLSIRTWCTLIYGAQTVAFMILALSETRFGLTLGSALFGATMGLVITIQPLTVAYIFGREFFGRFYGAIYLAIRVGAAIGPVVIGGVLALAGSYAVGWTVVAAGLLIAILILPVALRPIR
jgi:predicted MFS family arabinose efflux permease